MNPTRPTSYMHLFVRVKHIMMVTVLILDEKLDKGLIETDDDPASNFLFDLNSPEKWFLQLQWYRLSLSVFQLINPILSNLVVFAIWGMDQSLGNQVLKCLV